MRPLSALLQLALIASSITLILCCDTAPDDGASNGGRQTPSVEVAEEDAVVATVNGVPITASRVARLVRETGRPPREVVEELIDFELLSAEAAKRGHDASWEARHAERQALVQRYLDLELEPNARPEDIPESLLRTIYQEKRRSFVHPRLYKVAHIVVMAEEGKASPAKRREAHELAQSIRAESLSAKDVAEFKAIAQRRQGEKGFELRYENFVVHEKSRFAKAFVDATLELEDPGDISEPVDTQFGAHVIYVDDVREASNRSFEEAREEVRTKSHPLWLKREFLIHTDELRLATTVKGYAGPRRRVAQK